MSVPGPDTGHRETQAALRKLHRWFSFSSLSMRWVATYATSSEYAAVSAVQTQRMASGARAAGLRLVVPTKQMTPFALLCPPALDARFCENNEQVSGCRALEAYH